MTVSRTDKTPQLTGDGKTIIYVPEKNILGQTREPTTQSHVASTPGLEPRARQWETKWEMTIVTTVEKGVGR